MTTTLFTNLRCHRLPALTGADWLLVDGDRMAGLGDDDDRPSADRTIDLDGAVMLPAFVDAHVHLPTTGLYQIGMDLRGSSSAEAIVAAFRERAESDSLLFGGNFEDPLDEPLTRDSLDRAVGYRPALLARADMHSCVVSTALLDRLELEGLQGVDRDEEHEPTGYLRETAAARAWTWFDNNLPEADLKAATAAAVRLAYSKGVASVHEMHIVEWRGWAAFDALREAVADVSLGVVPYIATADVSRVVALGYPRIGGDYFLDGSFGSHTAWLSRPYEDPPPEGTPPNGISYRSDDEVLDFFLEAQTAELQVGVHAIGDRAIEQAIAAWEGVAERVGLAAVRRKGHRIEHFECATDDHMVRAARLGLRASVQPAFDRLWGGEDGLYARRIGARRALQMNRFGSMIDSGVVLGAGSDTTVTPLDPMLQMASLRTHHVDEESLGKTMALRAHTMGSRTLASGRTLDGTLEPGAVADLVVLDRDPIEGEVEDLLATQVLATWIGGRRVWPLDEAEAP